MTAPESFDAGVAHHIGQYADAVRIPAGHDRIVTSGTPGLRADGSISDDITEQSTQAWRNVSDVLARAGATLADVVSVRQWLTNADDIAAYAAVRKQFITHEPTFMLGVIDALVWPTIKVEIEVVAAVPAS